MTAIIYVIEKATGEFVDQFKFDDERDAQDMFDVLTENGSEHDGYYQYDLVAHAPSQDCVRRTMYMPKGKPQLV